MHALLSDPGEIARQALHGVLMLPSANLTASAPANSNLSGLNHTAYTLAVYASQLGSRRRTLRKTRFRLVANLAGRASAREVPS